MWPHNSSWSFMGQTKVNQLDFKWRLFVVHQHDVCKLQVCVYDLNSPQMVQCSSHLKNAWGWDQLFLMNDILVAASIHGGAHTCCTIGLISFSRSGWKFLSFNRWWRLLSSCSNSRYKSPLSSKALYHRTILHLSGSRIFSFCRLAIYGHRCQIDNYQIECFSSIAAWYHCAFLLPTSQNASIRWERLINLSATIAVSFTLVHFATVPKVPRPKKDSTRKRLGPEIRKFPGCIWSSGPGLCITVESIAWGFHWPGWMWT